MSDLFVRARAALLETDCDTKCAATQSLKADWDAGALSSINADVVEEVFEPGRPAKPVLVSPRDVQNRSAYTLEGRGALIHAIAHIEFNAINLALDAAYRFRGLPSEYYGDWLQVAAEEAYHFTLLREHLRTLGYEYGAFTAHNGLWEMALKTAHDPLARMGLVPRVLEARGLDVSPALIEKLRRASDPRAVEILEIIQRDEVGHVRVGNRWYRYLCVQRGVDPLDTFRRLLEQHGSMRLRTPFDTTARREAGFTESELVMLEAIAEKNNRKSYE